MITEANNVELNRSLKLKEREIEELKETVSSYMNRLENVMADMSTLERNNTHLTENITMVKGVNKELVLQLEKLQKKGAIIDEPENIEDTEVLE